MVRKYFCTLSFFLLIVLTGCQRESDPYFVISSDRVGLLDMNTAAHELEDLYQADSVVRDTLELSLGIGNGKMRIYEKGGKHLLTVTPGNDSLQLVKHVLIADPRFKTEKGIGLSSTFGDIKKEYPIQKVVTSLNNVVVFIKESDIYFTIDKKELPAHLRYTKTRPIEMVEIPDQAKIKYLMVGWDG